MMAGSVVATSSGHKIIADFERDKVFLRIPKFRSVLNLRKTRFPEARSVLKAIAANHATVYRQLGQLKPALSFPVPGWLASFLLTSNPETAS